MEVVLTCDSKVVVVLVGILRHVFHSINLNFFHSRNLPTHRRLYDMLFLKIAQVSFCSFMVSTSPVTFLLSLLYPSKAGWKTERPPPRLSQSFLYLTTMLSLWCFQCCCELAPLTTATGSEARLALWFTDWLLPCKGRGVCLMNVLSVWTHTYLIDVKAEENCPQSPVQVLKD